MNRFCNELNLGCEVVLKSKEILKKADEKKFFKKLSQKPYKVDFDEFGSFVWKLCDGKLSVKDIAEKFKANFGDKAESSEERVAKFLSQLSQNKLIQLYKKVNKELNKICKLVLN